MEVASSIAGRLTTLVAQETQADAEKDAEDELSLKVEAQKSQHIAENAQANAEASEAAMLQAMMDAQVKEEQMKLAVEESREAKSKALGERDEMQVILEEALEAKVKAVAERAKMLEEKEKQEELMKEALEMEKIQAGKLADVEKEQIESRTSMEQARGSNLRMLEQRDSAEAERTIVSGMRTTMNERDRGLKLSKKELDQEVEAAKEKEAAAEAELKKIQGAVASVQQAMRTLGEMQGGKAAN